VNYWIICITEDNLRITLRQQVIGFAESKGKLLKSFQPGDLVVFYVSRESLSSGKRVGKFIGLAAIKGESYRSFEPMWKNGLFPQRINIEALSEKSCDIRSLIDRLRFIKNKAKWGATFMPGIIRVSQDDFETVRSCMN